MKEENFLEELQQEKAKFEQKLAFELKAAESKQSSPVKSNVTAKLPKLEISKFTGTILDFNRFYNLFEAQVNWIQLLTH